MNDPSELTDNELIDRITAVYKQMTFYRSMGNGEAFQQASLIYQQLVEHQQQRAAEAYQKMIDADKGGSDDYDFSDKIDISK